MWNIPVWVVPTYANLNHTNLWLLPVRHSCTNVLVHTYGNLSCTNLLLQPVSPSCTGHCWWAWCRAEDRAPSSQADSIPECQGEEVCWSWSYPGFCKSVQSTHLEYGIQIMNASRLTLQHFKMSSKSSVKWAMEKHILTTETHNGWCVTDPECIRFNIYHWNSKGEKLLKGEAFNL